MSIGARCRVHLFIPHEAFTYGGVCHLVCAVVHRQVQSVNAGTSCLVGVAMSIGARCRVHLFIPHEAFTYGGVCHLVCAVIHRQVQSDNTVAASFIREVVRVITGLAKIRMFIPIITIADNCCSIAGGEQRVRQGTDG